MPRWSGPPGAESRQNGRRPALRKARRGWLTLSAQGAPAWALTWKNLTAAQRELGMGSVFLAVTGLASAGFVAYATLSAQGGDLIRELFALACFGVAAMTALFGPLSLRLDLRRDLSRLERIRALPLPGSQVVLAEIAGPSIILVSVEIVALVLGYLGLWRVDDLLAERALRTSLLFSAVLVLPAVTLASLVAQNAVALFLPAWFAQEQVPVRGFEAIGRRIVNLFVTFLALTVGALPAALVGGGLFFLLAALGLFHGAIVLGSLGAAAVVAGMVALSARGLGSLYEALDANTE